MVAPARHNCQIEMPWWVSEAKTLYNNSDVQHGDRRVELGLVVLCAGKEIGAGGEQKLGGERLSLSEFSVHSYLSLLSVKGPLVSISI